MRYEFFLTPNAERDLGKLPREGRLLVGDQLIELAGSPTILSHPVPSPPFPPGGLVYHISGEVDGHPLEVDVFFHYGQDEQSLIIEHIGFYFPEDRPERMDTPDPDGWLDDYWTER